MRRDCKEQEARLCQAPQAPSGSSSSHQVPLAAVQGARALSGSDATESKGAVQATQAGADKSVVQDTEGKSKQKRTEEAGEQGVAPEKLLVEDFAGMSQSELRTTASKLGVRKRGLRDGELRDACKRVAQSQMTLTGYMRMPKTSEESIQAAIAAPVSDSAQELPATQRLQGGCKRVSIRPTWLRSKAARNTYAAQLEVEAARKHIEPSLR